MKKGIALTVAASLLLAGCGRPQYLGKGTEQRYYPTYGVFNGTTNKSKNVCYELSFGNIIWSLILIETVIGPAYFIGFDIFNPVRMKNGPDDQCTIDG